MAASSRADRISMAALIVTPVLAFVVGAIFGWKRPGSFDPEGQ